MFRIRKRIRRCIVTALLIGILFSNKDKILNSEYVSEVLSTVKEKFSMVDEFAKAPVSSTSQSIQNVNIDRGLNFLFKLNGINGESELNSLISTVAKNSDNSQTDSEAVVLNNDIPFFTDSDKTVSGSFEIYSDLDSLGRCGVAFSCIGKDTMPTAERGEIGQIKPSGWHTVKYPEIIKDKYLYNRCHLIAYCLTGENANVKNLITGTRYLNVELMLPYETKVAKYVEKTGNHVLYRVTPVFEGANLVASGVMMEGYSVEDNGEGICFNVYLPNIQPGINIDYTTGDSCISTSYSI